MLCLILGGYGNTGRPIAEYLLKETQVQITLAGRSLEKAQAQATLFNERFPGKRVSAAQVDAADPQSLRHAFQNTEMVIAASSTAEYTENIARAAISARIDYFDVQYSTAKVNLLKALKDDIEQAGCCFITEGGFHPGLPAALIRYAALHFDCLDTAHIGSVIKIDWKTVKVSPSTAEELSRELLDFQTLVYKNGAWVNTGWSRPRRFDFGEPFGVRSGFPMMLEEMRSLPERIPSLKETGFYVGGFNPVVDYALMPAGYLLLKLAPKKGVKPFSKMLLWGLEKFSRPPYGTILQLEAEGTKNGQPHTLKMQIAHEDGYVFTAIPVVASLLQYDSIRRPGLWLQGLVVEPERLITDMQRMGIHVTC